MPDTEDSGVNPQRYADEVYPTGNPNTNTASYQANVGPTSDPNAPYVDPQTPDVEFTRENREAVPANTGRPFNEQADEWLAAKQADVEAQRGTENWVEDYPDWVIWRTDDNKGVWHAAHKNSVDYFQVSTENELKDLLGDYGKDKK